MRVGLIVFLAVLAGGVVTISSALFTVRQDQQALILQFGNPIRVIQEPGLHVKAPFIQNVEYYDRRILDLDPPVQSVVLADQKRVNVDSFARYRIIDPLKFRQRAGTDATFRNRFGSILNSAVRAEIGKILLGDMLTEKRAEVMDIITEEMKKQAPEFGTEVVDVRIGRTDLPEETAQAVYNRMQSDRQAFAADLRARGEEQALRIRSQADKDRAVIIAEAQQKAEIVRGQGDAERTNLLNKAYGRDPEFFDFYRSLDALNVAVGEGTSMVLSPDSELFQFFNAISGGDGPRKSGPSLSN